MDDKSVEESETPKPFEYRRMVSDVWEYCTRISDTLVQCNHCSKVMSFHGTTNIRVHVGRHFGMKPVRCRSTGRLPKNIKLPPANTAQPSQLQTPQPSPQIQPQPSPPPLVSQKKSSLPPLAAKPSGTKLPQAGATPTIKQPPKLLPKPQSPPEVCLRWNSYHSNMQNTFPSLLNNEQFVDVTLACDGRSIKCHKVMLSACSPYMEELLSSNPCQHPIIFLKDMKFWQLQALVDFMYRGEVNVTQDKLPSLLSAAEALQIKGLASPVNHNAPPKITQVQSIPTPQHDLSEDMDQVTYMRQLQLQSDIKNEFEDEYMQDTDESPPPTPKIKKRKTSHSVQHSAGNSNGTSSSNSSKQIIVNKPKRDKERQSSEPSTSQNLLNTSQSLLNQHSEQRRKGDPEKVTDSENEYKNYSDENRHSTNQDDVLDIDEEQAQLILERYSSQNEDCYSRAGDGEADDNSTTSG
ncbi:UNVERIFIED_CONTAM: hypothetical protein PYX00_002284 [Menopon gallinae]|uniref:BTB domain-containing protein n=1 Tax=Menopon gallinae TaxID=328185 RepID=A0AAW2IG34_9NEOP